MAVHSSLPPMDDKTSMSVRPRLRRAQSSCDPGDVGHVLSTPWNEGCRPAVVGLGGFVSRAHVIHAMTETNKSTIVIPLLRA